MAYLLFVPLVAFVALTAYILIQDFQSRANRLFALYLAAAAVATCGAMIVSTTPDADLASAGLLIFLVGNYLWNPFAILMAVLARFFSKALSHWYVLPLFLGITVVLSAALVGDALLASGFFYTRPPSLGQGFVNPRDVLVGIGGSLVRYWFLAVSTAAIVVVFVAWLRRHAERTATAFLGGALVITGIVAATLPPSPLSAALPGLILAVAITVVVGRYRLLLSSRVTLNAVFRTTNEGLVIYDASGQVALANPAVERLTGIPPEAMHKQPLDQALVPLMEGTTIEPGRVPLEIALAPDTGPAFDTLLRFPEPTRRSLAVTGTAIEDDRGRRLGGLVTLRDVTDRERFRQLLQDEQTQRTRVEETTARLEQVIAQVRTGIARLYAASTEILAAATQQASGASEQSAAISQATTTIDEVRVIAEQVAQRAQSVADVAQRTAQVSQAGRQSTATTIAEMEQVKRKVETIAEGILALSEQAQAIGGIIATVSEIAAQSNMLALNAAVEAARAGEAGRGFAVVAGEVRTLAEQSRAATTQIKEILTEIQRGVNTAVMLTEEGMKGTATGVQVAGLSGEALRQLAEGVDQSAQAAQQIAAATGQQLTGMEQISQAMGNVNQVTAQTVAAARQTERAAEELERLAVQLREVVEAQG
jgi:PAS domain S-box-containing protein